MEHILFKSNTLLYLFVFVFIPVIVLKSIKIKKQPDILLSRFFDKSQTDVLKGISILMILIHHFTLRMIAPHFMSPFLNVGFLGVGIFFFLSGFGLMSSYLRKPNYLKGFFSKRISRVYIPSILANIFIGLLGIVLGQASYSFNEMLSTSLLLQSIATGKVIWYINATIIFYLYFYLALKYLKPSVAIKTMFVCATLYVLIFWIKGFGTWWYNTAFAFPLGALFAYKRELVFVAIKNNFTNFILLFCFSFLVTFAISMLGLFNKFIFDTLSALSLVGLIVIIMYKFNFKSKFLTLVGSISYEIFLIHSPLFDFFYRAFPTKQSGSFYLLLTIIIIISLLLKKVSILIQIIRKRSISLQRNA